VIRPPDHERVYIEAVLGVYCSLPQTPERPSRRDRLLARELCRSGVPLRVVRDALILAAARRTIRSGPALPQVRTLHYFSPAIDEVLHHPQDPDYIAYLAVKLQSFASKMPNPHSQPPRSDSRVS
jgi:hypothetical protein